MAVTRKSALQLAAWVAVNDPALFAEFQRRLAPVRLSGLGSFRARSMQSRLRRMKLGALGQSMDDLTEVTPTTGADLSDLGDDNYSSLSEVTPTTGADLSSLSNPSALATIAPTTISLAPLDLSSVDSSLSEATASVPDVSTEGIVSQIGGSLGRTVSSLGSDVVSAVSAVGSVLTTGGGLVALSNLARAYYGAQTAQAQVTAMQIAQANQGLPPAPVGYAYNSAGQLVPVTATGAVTASLSELLPYLLVGGGILLVIQLMGR